MYESYREQVADRSNEELARNKETYLAEDIDSCLSTLRNDLIGHDPNGRDAPEQEEKDRSRDH
jgi:hypothetical protein